MATPKRNGDDEGESKTVGKTVSHSHSNSAALAATLDAIEACMRRLQLAKSEQEKKHLDQECRLLLEKAESLKNATRSSFTVDLTASQRDHNVAPPLPVLKLQEPRPTRALSTREQIILLGGSRLHGYVFPPWRESPSGSEFELKPGEALFKDETELSLSDVQLEIFDGWRRPGEALSPTKVRLSNVSAGAAPTMTAENDIDLIQDVTTDCSVVASLCAGIARASRGHSKIISSIFYPYNHDIEKPAFSPNGKYIFRLHFNGCSRKVVIDDLLPASNTTRTLHVIDRNNPGLLWPALVEKAYLKIRGGYDFPGSNSGTDLWVMTGWIPEQVFLQSDDVVPSSVWRRVFNAFKYGDVLVTVGTGKLTEREEECLGLAAEHDYAIIDMKEDGDRPVCLIKNPWSEGIIWKGNILRTPDQSDSPNECLGTTNSTRTIGKPPPPGSFWMDLKDIFQNFGSMYLNWNPGLFSYREDIHFTWDVASLSSSGGSFARNPQYQVYSNSGGIVWLLLSKHLTSNSQESKPQMRDLGADGKDNGSFISLYAFESNGEKVVLNEGAIVRGPYVDSPNTLLKLQWPASTSYTVVVSEQGLPSISCTFTLSAFSVKPISITEARDKYSHHQMHHGAWTLSTSGGNASSGLYSANPQYSISLRNPSDVSLLLECYQGFPVHLKLVWANGKRITSIKSRDVVVDSGEYRVGYAFAQIQDLQAGKYTIVCSTFELSQLGKFTLRIGTMSQCAVERLPIQEAGRMVSNIPTALFLPGNDRLVAPLFVHQVTRLSVVSRPRQSRQWSHNMMGSPIRLGFEHGQGPSKKVLGVSGDREFVDDHSSLRIQETVIQPSMCHETGLWIAVERLGCSGIQDTEGVDVDILSDEPIEVGQWKIGDE